jgi:signal transduction histidine kinase
MDSSALIDRLCAHRTLGSVPREELAWLAKNGHEQTLVPGDVLTPSTGPVRGLYVVLDGHLSIRVDSGAGPRIVMEWRAGDVTGILPYSRIKAPPGDVIAEEPSRILAVDAGRLPDLIHECPELTAVFVHVMLDRARVFKSSELLDEKMASLGRLAAGLAHELNNPASAVARSAKTLVASVAALETASKPYCSLDLPDAHYAAIATLLGERAGVRVALSPLERADREEAIADWLDAHDVVGVDVGPLVEAGFRVDDLDALDRSVGAEALATVIAYVSSALGVRQLSSEIDTAATRIHSLVAAVKGFTYVNQQATRQPIAIRQGLSDTITVLKAKAKSKSVEVQMHLPDDLPAVEGYGGELNQVWANLIDNAIDATPGGHVSIGAECVAGKVIVNVTDDGPGIPADVVNRIFDPFFTTKEVGQGTGLGLDIAQRIVQRHHGAIDVTTGPGGTEFRVTLPAVAPAAASASPPKAVS